MGLSCSEKGKLYVRQEVCQRLVLTHGIWYRCLFETGIGRLIRKSTRGAEHFKSLLQSNHKERFVDLRIGWRRGIGKLNIGSNGIRRVGSFSIRNLLLSCGFPRLRLKVEITFHITGRIMQLSQPQAVLVSWDYADTGGELPSFDKVQLAVR
jgi:hypothetical protein